MIQLAEMFSEPAATNDRAVPADFVEVSPLLGAGIERRFGYLRDARFVGFFYEPRGEEVIWNDGGSYGFAPGAWQIFADEVRRITETHLCRLGNSASPAKHMLVVDRVRHSAYVVDRERAERFLAKQHPTGS
jgi:hypothetical protein